MTQIRYTIAFMLSLALLSGCSKQKSSAPAQKPDAPAQKDLSATGDISKLQGTWSVVSGESIGEAAPKGAFDGATVMFTGTKATLLGKEGTFEVDDSKRPRWIEFARAGSKQVGIYELSGDDLKFCVGPTDDRPKEFKTKPRTDHTLLVLKKKR
jgi:uncharacterized protein (TIGR03067 family)